MSAGARPLWSRRRKLREPRVSPRAESGMSVFGDAAQYAGVQLDGRYAAVEGRARRFTPAKNGLITFGHLLRRKTCL
jgi:hypothetical protein